MPNTSEAIGSPIVKRINALLLERGISKKQFFQDCGITSAAYSQWNTGKTAPRQDNLVTIASYLGTTAEYLLTGHSGTTVALPDITEDMFKAAMWLDDTDMDENDRDEMWREIKEFKRFKTEQKRKEKRNQQK